MNMTDVELQKLGVTQEQFDLKMFEIGLKDHIKSFNEDAQRNGSDQRAFWNNDACLIEVQDIEGSRATAFRPIINTDGGPEDPYLLFEEKPN